MSTNPVIRFVWLTVGALALGLGALGVVLPLLPTTPFVLLAAYCFARSSKRWHAWLVGHKVFGPIIEDWYREGAISRQSKIAAAISMVAIFGLSLALGASRKVLIVQALVLSASASYVLSRPAPTRQAEERDRGRDGP